MFHYDLQNTGRVASDVGRRAGLSVEWEFIAPRGTISSTPVMADETVYFGCDDSNLYAVDASTGEQQWQFTTSDSIESSPALFDETIYIGSNDHSIYAIDTASGDEMWSFEANREIVSSPKVKDGTVFVGSNDGNLYALDSQTGAVEWSYDTGAAIQSAPAINNSTIYVGNDDGGLYAIDLTDGQLSWSFDESLAAVTAAPVVEENTVYFGVESGDIYAIDLESKFKTEKWRYDTKAGVTGSPALGDDRLYVPDNGNRLTAINTSDGSEAWSAEVVDGIATPVTLGDRSVYVGHGTDGGANVLSLFTTGDSDSDGESDSSTEGQHAVSVTIGYRAMTAPLVTSDRVIVGTDGAALVAASAPF
jgi:outer membrane protein assembly factor BamB